MADPNFLSPVTNPFGLTTNGAYSSKLIFADIDGDGDLDAFIGDVYGRIDFFRNTGDNTAPTFSEEFDTFGLTNTVSAAAPTLADIDGDGDLDAFIGIGSGEIDFFPNVGDNTAPTFGSAPANAPFDQVDVGYNSTPTFADIDGDGDLDAFIGESYGDTKFFRNTGDNTAPTFTEEPDNFGLINVGGAAAPTFADIDGDGDLDAFIGERYGETRFFRNTGDNTAPTFSEEPDNFGLTNVGGRAAPTFVDIDGDGDLDAFIGSGYGEIKFFENGFINTAPDAVDDTVTTDEDSLLSGNVLTNDSDAESDPLTVTAVNGNAADVNSQVTLTSGALLTVNSDGTFDYDPNGQFESLNNGDTASDSFTYTIDDGNGGTDTATVNVTIDGVTDNTPPVAVDDAVTTDEDSLLSGNVLTNDSDPDGDTLTVTEVNGNAADVDSQVTLTSGALLTVNSDGTFDYDPNGQYESLAVGESTTDTFTYTIDDGNAQTDTETATVTIDGVNDAPILAQEIDDQIISTNEILSFDTSVYFSDVDTNDTLTYSASNLPSGFSIDTNTGIITGSSSSASITPITITADDGNGGTISDTFELILANNQGTPNPDVIVMNMVSGNRINAKASDDVIFGSSANEKLGGWTGDDEIDGDGGHDVLSGGWGHDTLTGGDGDDKLFGGFGNDLLDGGLGEDTIVGGFGQDTIVIASGEGTDTIRFFQKGVDKIGLADGLTYNDLSFSGNDIIETSTNQVLAEFQWPWLNAANIDSSDFIAV
ncbi:Ig-like domain-containing protein [Dapis sp. BLCC M126]|uniref:Ig-like domain-containing protein n=1 Tax=Dapis sp. BLCC M126 TaxID=3400189 RepID=UPI003CF26F2B